MASRARRLSRGDNLAERSSRAAARAGRRRCQARIAERTEEIVSGGDKRPSPRAAGGAGRVSAAAVVVLPAPRRAGDERLGEQSPQDVREDPAVPEVLALARGVEADARAELLVVGAHRHLAGLAVLDAARSRTPHGRSGRATRALAVHELQRQHAHHQEVRAVDALVALRDHRLTPSRFGPFAAQSRDEPEPYSLPASTIGGVPSAW